MARYYLTKQKLKEIKKELEALKKERIKKSQLGAPPVLHSEELNVEFVSFQEDLDNLDSKIQELEDILENFELIKKPPRNKRDTIFVGATVTVKTNNKTEEFTILGTPEADPTVGIISNESPLGRALLGHKVGERVRIYFPVKRTYEIKKIEYKGI